MSDPVSAALQSAPAASTAPHHYGRTHDRPHPPAPSLPSPPGALPVIGHALRLRRDPLRLLDSMRELGDLVAFQVHTRHLVMVCDPGLTRQMLSDDRTYDKGGPIPRLVAPLVGDGLATCPHRRHRAYRRLMQPLLHPGLLPGYLAHVPAQTAAVTGQWHEGQLLDIPAMMRRIALRSAMQTWFSDALPEASVDRLGDDFTTALVGFAQQVGRPQNWDRLPTRGNRHRNHAIARIRHTVQCAVDARRSTPTDQHDLLTALLTPGPDGRHLADQVIVDHATTFIAASTATVASVLSWACHLLAQHPDIARRVQQEADTAALLASQARIESPPDLPFTNAVITETLRLYPSLWLGTRVVTTDAVLGGHALPAGTVMAYSPYITGRSSLYPDPHRFDPDRWNPAAGNPASRHGLLPFGGGARQCIAVKYAPLEITLALATIAANWNLTPVAGTPLQPRAAANLTPRGLTLKASARTPRPHTVPPSTASGTQRITKRPNWLI